MCASELIVPHRDSRRFNYTFTGSSTGGVLKLIVQDAISC
jgi:hypothetical protein